MLFAKGFARKMESQSLKFDLEGLLDQAEEGYLIPCRRDNGSTDLHAQASNGDTLLHVAVGQRDFAAIRYLLNAGLDINSKGDFHMTPLRYATMGRGDIGMLGFLMQHGADPTIPDCFGMQPGDALLQMIREFPEDFLSRLSDWMHENAPDKSTQAE